MIAPLRAEHSEQVAILHCATLTGLLTRLGPAAARAYYTGCARSNLAVGLVDLESSLVRGFVVGSLHPDRLQRDVMRANPIGTVAGIVGGILSHPPALAWLVKSVRGPDEGSFDASAPGLIYLSVSQTRRGSGVGRQLVDAFTERMRAAGADHYDLSVDEDNQAGIAFYERLGFRQTGTYHEFGALHRRYRLTLR